MATQEEKIIVKPSNPKVILLGVYLLLFLLTSLFFLSNLIMVDPCPISKNENSTVANTVSNTEKPSNSATSTNVNSTVSNANSANKNNTPNVENSKNPTEKPTQPAKKSEDAEKKSANSKDDETKNKAKNTEQKQMDTELGQPTIARIVRVNFWGFFNPKSKTESKPVNSNNNSSSNSTENKTTTNEKDSDTERCNDTVASNQTLLSADGYLFFLVLFAGLLGASVRAIWSMVKHIAFLKNFSFDSTWYYITLPFTGAALALVLYFVLRGGFYGAPIGNALILNTFSFAALAVVTGLFTGNAMKKLEQIAGVILAPLDDEKKNKTPIEDKKNNESSKPDSPK